MDKLDIMLWVMSGGFSLMLLMWHSLNQRMDKFDERMTKLELDMVEVKIILKYKECCMISNEKNVRKVE